MKALLIVAHGSRKKESSEEVLRLAAALEIKAKDQFDSVRAAFIQFSPPYVPDVISELNQKGVTEVVVLPYFIAGGSHVTQDIPELLAEAKRTYPKIRFALKNHLGKFDKMADFILSEISTSP